MRFATAALTLNMTPPAAVVPLESYNSHMGEPDKMEIVDNKTNFQELTTLELCNMIRVRTVAQCEKTSKTSYIFDKVSWHICVFLGRIWDIEKIGLF